MIKQTLKVKAVSYVIRELSHRLDFIVIFKTPFKYHLVAINQQSFRFEYNVSFLNLPRELAEDRGLTMVEYGTQKAAPHLSNAAWMLTVEKIEQTLMLVEAPSL